MRKAGFRSSDARRAVFVTTLPEGKEEGFPLSPASGHATADQKRSGRLSAVALLCRDRTGQTASSGPNLHQYASSVEYEETDLAFYTVAWHEDNKHIPEVSHARLVETSYRSPQLTLWTLGPDEWLLAEEIA
jgi:hypothetical protein